MHKLELNKLYIIVDDALKNIDFFKDIPDSSFLINTENISKLITGQYNGIEYSDIRKDKVINITKELLDARMNQKMATIILDKKINQTIIQEYISIALNNGMDYSFLVSNKFNNYELDKSFYTVIDELNIDFVPELILTKKLDILGDTHGLKKETISLLSKNNWFVTKDNYLENTDKDRKLLFLGDILDRGTESIELLELVCNTVNKGNGYLILGNHEDKLIASYKEYKKNNKYLYKSISSSETFSSFLRLDEHKKEKLFNFLLKSPVKLSIWINKDNTEVTNDKNKNLFKLGFCHATNKIFDENFMPKSLALYGEKNKNADKDYNDNYNKKINNHILFRGHVLEQSKENTVFSLEEDQAFEGNLVLLKIDEYIKKIKDNNWVNDYTFFNSSTIKEKTEFNFNKYLEKKMKLLREMDNLVKLGLATNGWRKNNEGKIVPHEDGFKVYKYSKAVHFKRLWKTNEYLEKARGIVLDASGNIVVNPFDKLYNFGEYDVGQNISKEKDVQVIEKLNGYLGCISKHPFKNELLVTTTGSIQKDSPFIKMIYDYITPEMNGKLLNYFKDNKKTLMFEVIHKEDPHIIEYKEEEHGLWLIGSRGLDLNSKVDTEEEIDKIAKKLDFKRPKWEIKKFGDVLIDLQKSELEGFMIRDNEDNKPLMKIKTNYYLVTKFVGRMGDKMVKMMFNHSEQFKEEKVDEEFYPIVDKIITRISEDDFKSMDKLNRVSLVRNIVNETRDEFLNKKQVNIKL